MKYKQIFSFVLASVVLLLASSHADAQTTKTWNGSVNSDWFNANNWTPAGVPATNDTVNFNSGTINFTSPVLVAGQFNWAGGTLAGSPLTIATNGTMNLNGNGGKTLQNVLTNRGTITLSGSAELNVYNNNGVSYSGGIYNLPGAVFDIQSDRGIGCACYGPEFFNNAGTLRKTAGTGTSIINVSVTNTATVTSLSGTLNFNNGGKLGGTYTTGGSTTINFNGGNFSYDAAAEPVLTGNTRLTGGTLTFHDSPIPNLALLDGTVALDPAFQGGTITNLNLIGAKLSGNYSVSGNLNAGGGISGQLQILNGATVTWSGGTLSGSINARDGSVLNWAGGTADGPINIATNALLNLLGSSKTLQAPLTNAGTMVWTGANDLTVYNNNGVNYSGAIYNLAGALFDIQNDRSLSCACYGYEFLNNAGLVRKSLGVSSTSINVAFTNSGTVSVLTNNLNLNRGSYGGVLSAATGSSIKFLSGGVLSGSFNAASGAVISFDNGTFTAVPSTVTFSGAGICRLPGIPCCLPWMPSFPIYNCSAVQFRSAPSFKVERSQI